MQTGSEALSAHCDGNLSTLRQVSAAVLHHFGGGANGFVIVEDEDGLDLLNAATARLAPLVQTSKWKCGMASPDGVNAKIYL